MSLAKTFLSFQRLDIPVDREAYPFDVFSSTVESNFDTHYKKTYCICIEATPIAGPSWFPMKYATGKIDIKFIDEAPEFYFGALETS